MEKIKVEFMLDEKSEKSIMEIISEMVREGESEENIRGTLKSVGVKEKEINRLLLVAQAHTFELLKSEIDKIIELHVSDKKPALKELIKFQVTKAAEQKIPVPKPEAIAGKEKETAKSNFFLELVHKIFQKKKAEGEKPREEPAFITPETAAWKEPAPAQEAEGEIYAFSKADLKRLGSLESWQTRYKKKFTYLKQVQRKSKLSEKQIAKKMGLETKIRAYGLKIGEIKRRIPKEFLKKTRKRRLLYKKLPEQLPPKESALELKTMQDLSEAAKAITIAAERIVRTAPKPKIVISGNEDFLTTDQEIEKTKRLKKRLEIDFYKRRISLQDFQTKMLEYQSKLYELEEKKKILEKSKELGKKPKEKVPASIEKALEQKLEGRMNEEKILEIENYATELLKRYNIPKEEIEKEIKKSDMSTLLANLEKMVTITQLEMQAKQALETSQKQAMSGISGPQITTISGTPSMQAPQEAGTTETQQPTIKQPKKGTTIIFGTPTTTPKGMRQMPKGMQPTGTATKGTTPSGTTQKGAIVAGTATAPETIISIAGAPAQPAQPIKQPKQRIIIIPPFFQPRAPAQKPAEPSAPAENSVETTIIQQQETTTKEAPETEPAIVQEKTIQETGLLEERKEPEKVVIKPFEEKKYISVPRIEPKKVIVEPEKSWSEAEIPSYPATVEKNEREKIKTIVKEISKYRIITDLDRVLQTIKEKGIMGIAQLNQETGIEKQRLQDLVEILEGHKLAKIDYSAFGEEKIMDINYVKPKAPQAPQKEKKQGLFSWFGKKQN